MHCSSFQLVWICTGSQLDSSNSRTSSEAFSRNHHLLRFPSDLYFLLTSICSPKSVNRSITFLTAVTVQLRRVPQILRTPEAFTLAEVGGTPSWVCWLGVAAEFGEVTSVAALVLTDCALVVMSEAGSGREWFWLDFFLLCLLPLELLFLAFLSWTGAFSC